MIGKQEFATAIRSISDTMAKNRDLLVKLDQVNGDGDLGISMDDGFAALATFMETNAPDDLGQALRGGAKVFNSAAPSSLGTILSFGLMGMAKRLRGQSEADFSDVVTAASDGLRNIMDNAESSPGEKTIIDALAPGVKVLVEASRLVGVDDTRSTLTAAASAARAGSESTRGMRAVHGRAAYSADRSVGVLDGGSVVGALIFESIAGVTGD